MSLSGPVAAWAQVDKDKVDPGYPPLDPGSTFVVNALIVLFTGLVLLITFTVPKRNAIDTERT